MCWSLLRGLRRSIRSEWLAAAMSISISTGPEPRATAVEDRHGRIVREVHVGDARRLVVALGHILERDAQPIAETSDPARTEGQRGFGVERGRGERRAQQLPEVVLAHPGATGQRDLAVARSPRQARERRRGHEREAVAAAGVEQRNVAETAEAPKQAGVGRGKVRAFRPQTAKFRQFEPHVD